MYLKLKFHSARLFRNHKESKSKNIQTYQDTNGNTKIEKSHRKDLGNFVEPISVFQVSNVIHKIFGKRPVPYFRKVAYSRDEYLFEKAKDSLLYIRPHYTDKKGNDRFLKETTRVVKSDFNAWKKNGHISWERVKHYFLYDDKEINNLKEYFNKMLSEDITENKPFTYYCKKLKSVFPAVNEELTIFQISNFIYKKFKIPIVEYSRKDICDKNNHISWEGIKHILSHDDSKFEKFKSYIKKVLRNKVEDVTEDNPFNYYGDKLKSVLPNEYKEFFIKHQMTPIYEFIVKDEISSFNAIRRSGRIFGNTVNFGIHNCEVLDGEILVPVTEEDLEYLQKYSKGTAKILDGGYVEIEGVMRNISRRDMDKYTIVSDLSEEIEYLTKK